MKAINAILVLLVVAVVGSAFAQDLKTDVVKETMKINLEKMGTMLDHILLDEGWDAVIKDAEQLKQHAQVIKNRDPSQYVEEMPKKDYFQSYAFHLESSSQNLKIVAEEIERERAAGSKKSGHLRPNAAVFFGQITSMCVNCHNQFREK